MKAGKVALALALMAGPAQAAGEADPGAFHWQARCEVTEANNRKKCTVARGPVGFVVLERAGLGMFCGAGLAFPAATVAARVDDNAPHEWSAGTHPPRKLTMLVAEAREGEVLRCREPKWPSGKAELEAKLDGFGVAMDAAERFIAAE